jgi:hypothetical protein
MAVEGRLHAIKSGEIKSPKCRHKANKRHFVSDDRPTRKGASNLTSDKVLHVTNSNGT